MKFIPCLQGTPEWLQARAGVCTASCFADAISTVGGLDERQAKYVQNVLNGMDEKSAAADAGYKAPPRAEAVTKALRGEPYEVPSDVSNRYAADLSIERISGKPYGEPPKTWLLKRGHEMERLARLAYEARTNYMVTESGLVLTDDNLFGYSTDGLVGDVGLIEVKCPIDSLKIAHIRETGDIAEYLHQIQGGLWITGRRWCDFVMYVPDLENAHTDLYIKRVHRNDKFIDDMVLKLAAFNSRVNAFETTFRMIEKEAA